MRYEQRSTAKSGSAKHRLNPSKETRTVATPPRKLPMGQVLADWENDFLLKGASAEDFLRLHQIHPDDVGGKLLTSLRRKPFNFNRKDIIEGLRALYRHYGLNVPVYREVARRFQDAEASWQGLVGAEGGTHQGPPAQDHETAYVQNLRAQIRQLYATQDEVEDANRAWEAAYQKKEAQLAGAARQLEHQAREIKGLRRLMAQQGAELRG
ncbi:hypothetical protein Slin15195_G041420 [Septoria linicola]|uniref:Uncharacterized protein n=1 Tax=Septoria linicola TaxID=215465 RepID=A0A9Q9EIY9_9PEZI|nr:hypothetical protein Slin14017_G044940 [Septoria linicola]USW50823.1 hypothetical protein Slin15195_G041420 [Septoria linicola]